MNIAIKKMHLENFKGIKEKDIDFTNRTIIQGKNASGKSTIASAYMWLMADKDINLASNPPVKPIGVVECTTVVSIVLDVDNKEQTLTKSQIIKTKTNEDGTVKSSTKNGYEINSVPKTERDFKSHLADLGLPSLDIMLMCSHTEVFTNMKQADMRKVLFEMASSVTDKKIAESLGNIPDVAALLDNYTIEEITAMNKATIKKCNEKVSIIPGQIQGLELAKTEDTDTSELELLKNNLANQVQENNAEIQRIRDRKDKYICLCSEGLRIEFDINSEIQQANANANNGRNELESKALKVQNEIVSAKNTIASCKRNQEQTEKAIGNKTKDFGDLKKQYESVKAKTFDTSNNICPCCGQTYPEEKVAELVKNFEDSKKAELKSINLKAKSTQNEVKEFEEYLSTINAELANSEKKLAELTNELSDLDKQIENFVPTEVVKSEKQKELENRLEQINAEKANMPTDSDAQIEELTNKNRELTSQANDIIRKIGESSNNVRIDEQIIELQDARLAYEQKKANAEKVLYQLDLLSKAKNEQLANTINSNFDLVDFKFFDYYKNGDYKEVCVPTIDGKDLGIATNNALEVAAKVDVCRGLQKHYGCQLPIWIDNFEAIDTANADKFNFDNQIIGLKVTDSDLTIGE